MQLYRMMKRTAPSSNWSIAKEIAKNKGIHGFYEAFSLHFIRDFFGTGAYFLTYNLIQSYLSKSIPNADVCNALSGGLAGCSSWTLLFPVDLIKSRMQKDVLQRGERISVTRIVDCIKDVKGIRGFYAGWTPTVLRAFPIHSINFLVYEKVLFLLKKERKERE